MGSIPPAGAEDIKGIRWKINLLGINEIRQVKFRLTRFYLRAWREN